MALEWTSWPRPERTGKTPEQIVQYVMDRIAAQSETRISAQYKVCCYGV